MIRKTGMWYWGDGCGRQTGREEENELKKGTSGGFAAGKGDLRRGRRCWVVCGWSG